MITSAFSTTVSLFFATAPLFLVTSFLPLNFREIFLAYFIELELPTGITFLEFVRSHRHRVGNLHVSDIWPRTLNGAGFSTNQSAVSGFAARCPKHRLLSFCDVGVVGQTQGTSGGLCKRLNSTAVDVLERTRLNLLGGNRKRGYSPFCTCNTWT